MVGVVDFKKKSFNYFLHLRAMKYVSIKSKEKTAQFAFNVFFRLYICSHTRTFQFASACNMCLKKKLGDRKSVHFGAVRNL